MRKCRQRRYRIHKSQTLRKTRGDYHQLINELLLDAIVRQLIMQVATPMWGADLEYTPCFIKTTPYLIAHNVGKC